MEQAPAGSALEASPSSIRRVGRAVSDAYSEVVGVIPMAGRAARLSPLPFSKELYPVGVRAVGDGARPKVVAQYLLDQMSRAGVRRAFLVLRQGKWDIPAYFGDGRRFGEVSLGYVIAAVPDGLPYSLDAATPFVRDCVVAMGFPDILLEVPDALAAVVSRQRETGADVVLGLFPWDDPLTDDMVQTDETGRVTAYFVREAVPHARFTWALAAWGPRFTEFLHNCVVERPPRDHNSEFALGRVLSAALAEGIRMQSVAFPDAGMLDIGTPDGLAALPAFLALNTA